ncbi:hypothetical protein ACFQ7B_42260 [Streptomyces erythrochromogenes]|uniref:hypothetical protein n=1 Tax=Streptomyces erythrochromogenes TaxID=285574 RepID=UPI0036B74FDB
MFTESAVPVSVREREVLFPPGHLGELTQVVMAALVGEPSSCHAGCSNVYASCRPR